MSTENPLRRVVVTSDIGQTVLDGGMHYFRDYAQEYNLSIRDITRNLQHLTNVYSRFVPFPGAQRGIQDISQTFDGFAGWYTVRPEVLGADKQLAHNGFISPDAVRVSKDSTKKLQQITQELIIPGERSGSPTAVILFDDNQEKIIRAGQALLRAESDQASLKQHILGRLTLVAYGSDQALRTDTGISTLALPSWDEPHVSHLKRSLSYLYQS